MLPIEHMDQLLCILEKERKDWQQYIFEKTGVWLSPKGDSQSDWDMFSVCGSGDLSEDIDVPWRNGKFEGPFITVKSVEDLVQYIEQMDTYQDKLKNISFGLFSKAELFWAIQSRIMEMNMDKDDPSQQIYGFRSIEGNEDLLFDMSVCGVDSFELDEQVGKTTTLQSILDEIAKDLEKFYGDQAGWDGNVPHFKYDPNREYTVPASANEILTRISALQY